MIETFFNANNCYDEADEFKGVLNTLLLEVDKINILSNSFSKNMEPDRNVEMFNCLKQAAEYLIFSTGLLKVMTENNEKKDLFWMGDFIAKFYGNKKLQEWVASFAFALKNNLEDMDACQVVYTECEPIHMETLPILLDKLNIDYELRAKSGTRKASPNFIK